MNADSTLGEILLNLRGSRSLREIAELTGGKISHNNLRLLEKGTVSEPKPETLKVLSEVYKYPYEKLMAAAGYLINDETDVQSNSNQEHESKGILSVEEYIEMARFGVPIRKGKSPLTGKQLEKLIQMMSTMKEIFDDEEDENEEK